MRMHAYARVHVLIYLWLGASFWPFSSGHLGTTHFSVRAPGPRDRQKPGEEPHPFRRTSVSSAHPAVSSWKEAGTGNTAVGSGVGRVKGFHIFG